VRPWGIRLLANTCICFHFFLKNRPIRLAYTVPMWYILIVGVLGKAPGCLGRGEYEAGSASSLLFFDASATLPPAGHREATRRDTAGNHALTAEKRPQARTPKRVAGRPLRGGRPARVGEKGFEASETRWFGFVRRSLDPRRPATKVHKNLERPQTRGVTLVLPRLRVRNAKKHPPALFPRMPPRPPRHLRGRHRHRRSRPHRGRGVRETSERSFSRDWVSTSTGYMR